MEPRIRWLFTTLLFFSSSFLSSLAMHLSRSSISIDSLNAIIRNSALHVLARSRTGVVYQVPLPSNLTGIEASAERLRGGNFWSKGARLSSIHIPPRTTTVPFVRRLAVVHQDLGNWSSTFFTLPGGYSFVAPVIGFLAYDTSDNSSRTRAIDLRVLGDPISIAFPRVTLPGGVNATVRCARLGQRGSAEIGDAAARNACDTVTTGHFTMVVPWETAEAEAPRKGEGRWWVWAVGIGGGSVGLVLVGSVGVGIIRVTRRRMEDMERMAEEGVDLGQVQAGRSRMPSAVNCRTKQVIEDGITP